MLIGEAASRATAFSRSDLADGRAFYEIDQPIVEGDSILAQRLGGGSY
jgi:hypothetical protein